MLKEKLTLCSIFFCAFFTLSQRERGQIPSPFGGGLGWGLVVYFLLINQKPTPNIMTTNIRAGNTPKRIPPTCVFESIGPTDMPVSGLLLTWGKVTVAVAVAAGNGVPVGDGNGVGVNVGKRVGSNPVSSSCRLVYSR